MKQDIHPKWYPTAQVRCACGKTFTVGATKPDIALEICAFCHPFFTGKMKYVDTMGRVEKFKEKQEVAKQKSSVLTEIKKKKREKEKELRKPRTLKEMLLEMK